MSFAIKQALQSDSSAEALKSLAEKGGMYHKGQDIAHALSTKYKMACPITHLYFL